jgi:hypothetical protein
MNGPYRIERLASTGGTWINITSGVSCQQSAIKSARYSQARRQGGIVRVVDKNGCLVAIF